jgi:hypothetical protein
MSSAAPSSGGSVDGIQFKNSASVGTAAGNRVSVHVEGAVAFTCLVPLYFLKPENQFKQLLFPLFISGKNQFGHENTCPTKNTMYNKSD